MHRGKVDPGVSELPLGNELSRDHVNRPKIEHEEIGTCARIEISQDADNTDQNVEWFLKVHKMHKLL